MQQAAQSKMNRAKKFGGLAVSAAVFVFGLAFAMPALATTSGPNNGSVFSDDSAVGSFAWLHPANALSSNDIYTTTTVSNHGHPTHYLKASGFNFNIPASSTINGIEVRIERKQTCYFNCSGSHADVKDDVVKLVKGVLVIGANHDSSTVWPSSDTVKTYGSATDKWTSTLWTVSDINSSTFGVVLSAGRDEDGVSVLSVDSISITVYYTLPVDTTAPVIASHSDVVIEATASNTPVTYTLPTATDNVDAVVVVTCSPASGTLFVVGTTPVLCSATDVAHNTATSTFNVIVQDHTAPVIAPHGNETVEATSIDGATVTYTAPNAVDAVDGTFAATCLPASGSAFILGTTPVVCNAADVHGNAAVATTFNVVVQDTIKPVITLNGVDPVNLHVGDVYVEVGAFANDNIDGDITSQIVIGGSVVDTSAPVSYYVTYNVTDSHGNAAVQVGRTVTVSDVLAPVINTIPDITVEATSNAGAVVDYGTVTSTDDVNGDVAIPSANCVPVSGSTFTFGDTDVICTATDSNSNTRVGVALTVTVQDTTAPEITITIPSLTVEATSSAGAEVSYTASATDIVDGSVALVECSPESNPMFPMGETTITCTAADAHGNRATSTATVTVVDHTAPEVTAPADQTFEVTGLFTSPVLVPATATDLVDPSPVVTSTPSLFPLGTTLVSWTAADASGNVSVVVTSHVTIQDTTAPVITLNGDATVTLTVGDTYTEQGAVLTDNYYTEVLVTIGGDVVNTAVAGTYHVTYDGDDSNGNHAVQKVRTVVVSSLPSTGGGSGTTYVAPTPPSFGDHPITIGAGLGNTSTVQLTFDVSNASWMAISETPDFVGGSWMPYTTSTTFTLSSGNTAHKLYIKFRRINGGETKVQEVTVLLNTPSTLIQAVLGIKITRLNELAKKLKLGNRGAEVRELQTLLKQAGFFPARQTATGYYGPITRAAVAKYLAAIK